MSGGANEGHNHDWSVHELWQRAEAGEPAPHILPRRSQPTRRRVVTATPWCLAAVAVLAAFWAFLGLQELIGETTSPPRQGGLYSVQAAGCTTLALDRPSGLIEASPCPGQLASLSAMLTAWLAPARQP